MVGHKTRTRITLVLRTLFCFLLCAGSAATAQSLDHPAIWVTDAERPLILKKIKTYSWAKSAFDQLRRHVEPARVKHVNQPGAILKTIPRFGGNQGKHNAILTLASESGMLYFLTQEESYGQLAADIIAAYSARLAPKSPQTTAIMGDPFFDGRTTYDQFALAYDFAYDFIKNPKTRVYDARKNKRVRFDHAATQKALWNVAGNILQEYGKPDKHGRVVSNHPVLTAPGALFPILCIEDDRERERLFNVFWDKGTHHQASFKNTLMRMYSKQGIWPESFSYSFMPNMIMILNIVDRLKPKMNVTSKAARIFEGTFVLANLNNPDGRSIRYGDSKRRKNAGADSLRYMMHLSDRRGYDQWKDQASIALKKMYANNGGYKPNLSNSVYGSFGALQLFWGLDIPRSVEGAIDYRTTVVVEHAGLALQRNFVEKKNELYGLNGYIGGAHYVHSHCTGIAMELYGAGYVMAPNGGLPKSTKERSDPVHEQYFRLYAGNNSVITNGTSHGRNEGSWKGKANVWQNTAVNIAAEPKHGETPVSNQFSFATQDLKDEVNRVRQQRTLSVIRTSPKTGYYVDVFRALAADENRFHDYIYHNIGDATQIANGSGQQLSLSPTKRYDNDIGDIVRSPGWRFFENEKASAPTDDAVKIGFHMTKGDRFMHMFVPGGVKREFTTAVGPPTREALNGYDKKKTQIVAIRKRGEAWDQPFISVFEPSTKEESSVQDVRPLMDRNKCVGAKVVSIVGKSRITDFIIALDSSRDRYRNREYELEFSGRFGVVRVEERISNRKRGNPSGNPVKKGSNLTFYLGEGSNLAWRDVSVTSKKRANTTACVEITAGRKLRVTPENQVKVVGAEEKDTDRRRPVAQKEMRTWTDLTGKFSVEAVLIGVKKGKVALRKSDGSRVILPIDKLSAADREFVRDATSKESKLLLGE
jgi:hypothetical protein